jgi:AraC-like DNA-binding protein
MATNDLDPYDDALSSLRIEGNILLHGYHVPPWSVRVPDATALRRFMGLRPDVQVIPFHLVLSGEIFLEPEAAPVIELQAGEVVLCPGGMSHRLFAGAASQSLDFVDVIRAMSHHPLVRDGDAHGAEMLCGFFALRSTPLNPLLGALPPLLSVHTQGAVAGPLLGDITQMLKQQLARNERGGFVISRLLEILCGEVFRTYGERMSRHRAGWFKALHDLQISRAVAQIHRAPGAPWTVSALAGHVAMSPSRFAARFREVTAQSVMSYVTAWRMNCACRELRIGMKPLGEVAAEVGYQDVAAFSRAFKAHVGLSPMHWRQQLKV